MILTIGRIASTTLEYIRVRVMSALLCYIFIIVDEKKFRLWQILIINTEYSHNIYLINIIV